MNALVNALTAAKSLGYEPQSDGPRDPQMRAFYAFATKHFPDAKRWIGKRLMFDQEVIASKVKGETVEAEEMPIDPSLHEAQQLAILHARGHRLNLRGRSHYPRAVSGGRS